MGAVPRARFPPAEEGNGQTRAGRPAQCLYARSGQACRVRISKHWPRRSHLGVTRYDGTVRSACPVYQEHPHSPLHSAKPNTEKFYIKSLKLIEHTVGLRLIRNLTVIDAKHWYEQWRKPGPQVPAGDNGRHPAAGTGTCRSGA